MNKFKYRDDLTVIDGCARQRLQKAFFVKDYLSPSDVKSGQSNVIDVNGLNKYLEDGWDISFHKNVYGTSQSCCFIVIKKTVLPVIPVRDPVELAIEKSTEEMLERLRNYKYKA